MNLFELATRKQYRFESVRGDLTTEHLWELSLLSGDGFDLDSVARTIHDQLEGATTKSFVDVNPDPRAGELEKKLEIVKHIIEFKQNEISAAQNRAEKAEKRKQLADALVAKEDEELKGKSKKQLLKELAELDD